MESLPRKRFRGGPENKPEGEILVRIDVYPHRPLCCATSCFFILCIADCLTHCVNGHSITPLSLRHRPAVFCGTRHWVTVGSSRLVLSYGVLLCYRCVTAVLPLYYRCVLAIRRCITAASPLFYRGVTAVSPLCYGCITGGLSLIHI